MPKVTIVMPAYNAEATIGEAIKSAQAQTIQDWELIVVNDGSSDDTERVVLQIQDTRIKYLLQANSGVSAARNVGIRRALGQYICFLDADDTWRPEFLERCLAYLLLHPEASGVYAFHQLMDQNGALLPQQGRQVVAAEHLRSTLVEGNQFAVHSAMVRTDAVRHIGFFDPALSVGEDWDFWFRLSEHHRLEGIPEVLALYRVNGNSGSTNPLRTHSNHCIFFEKHYGPLDADRDMWSEEKRRAYGFIFRLSGFEYLKQGQSERAWGLLNPAFSTWPPLLARLDTYFELICGDQPRGYRGQVYPQDWKLREGQVVTELDEYFSQAQPSAKSMFRLAHSRMYLALAMLADQAGNWSEARRFLATSIQYDRSQLVRYSILRRALKLMLGRRIVHISESWLPASRHQTTSDYEHAPNRPVSG